MKKRIVGTILSIILSMTFCAGCSGKDASDHLDETMAESEQDTGSSRDSESEQDAGSSTDSGSEQDTGSGTDSRSEQAAGNNIEKGNVEVSEYDESQLREGYIDYSIELLKKTAADEVNSMISPLSVMMAMDMAAAGAEGSTQDQIMQMFCLGANQAQIESYLSNLMERYQANKDVELHIANSIWINNVFAKEIKAEYLDKANQVFDATARVLSFDAAAVDEINGWVDKNTNGMITRLLNSLQPDTVLCLLNATAVEAPWAEPYEDAQVWEDDFTDASGQTKSVEMMHGTEEDYFETENAVGFLKYYEGGEYGFLAILPKEGKTVEEYLAGMTGESFREFYDTGTGEYKVHTMMPKFTYEYELPMNDVLYMLGVKDAFDSNLADFSGIASPIEGNLYIDLVLHKTFIEVGQYETKAAAATVVTVRNLSMPIEEEYREVYLNRPFIYAIIDTETGAPIFIGTLQSVQ